MIGVGDLGEVLRGIVGEKQKAWTNNMPMPCEFVDPGDLNDISYWEKCFGHE